MPLPGKPALCHGSQNERVHGLHRLGLMVYGSGPWFTAPGAHGLWRGAHGLEFWDPWRPMVQNPSLRIALAGAMV